MENNTPPEIAAALSGMGFGSLEGAREYMQRLSGVFRRLATSKRPNFHNLGRHSDCRMSERDFALFALFASIGMESLQNPLISPPAAPSLPEHDPRQLPIPGTDENTEA